MSRPTFCFNASITRKPNEIESHYNVTRTEKGKELGDAIFHYHANGFEHPNFWIITQENPKYINPVRWGMLPPYSANIDPIQDLRKVIGGGLNAQSEKLFSKSSYYPSSSLTRRCIIPVTAFFEPHTCASPKNYKVPFLFSSKDKPFVSLAGIYTITKNKYVSFALLTKEAKKDSMYAQIHNKVNFQGQHRQVVPLTDEQIAPWLSNHLAQ